MEINLSEINTTIDLNTIMDPNKNPWLGQSNLKSLINQELINDISKLSIIELTKYFNKLYILTLADNTEYTDSLFSSNITKSQYEYIKSKLVLRQIPFSILKNETVKGFMTIINCDCLPQYFLDAKGIKQSFLFDSKILVISMLNISDYGMNCFTKQFNGISSLPDIINMTLVNDYIQKDTFNEQNKMIKYQMINNIVEANYWVLKFNCKLNITLKFLSRGFNLNSIQRLDSKEVKEVIEKITIKSEEDTDYLSHIFRKQTYVDAAANIGKEGYQIYRINKIDSNEIISHSEFNNILDMCKTKRELYLMLTNLLVTKDYCHLIINNKNAIEKITNNELFNNFVNDKRSLLQKYTPLFSFLWSYAWVTMYLEESIKRSRIVHTDRFVFDLETASKLPYFPSLADIPTSSPYLPVLIADEVLNPGDNNLGVPLYCDVTRNLIPGVVNTEQFNERIKIFITGSSDKDYLKNIDWTNLAISGSIMAACLPRFNPLMLNFYTNNTIDYNQFFNEYYRDADVDIMYNSDKFSFIEKVHQFAEQIENNIRDQNNISNDQLFIVKITPVKSGAIMVNKEFITKFILPKTKLSYVDIIMKTHELEVKELFYPWYVKQKLNDNEQHLNTKYYTNPKYNAFFDLCKPNELLIVIIQNKYNKKEDTTDLTSNKQVFNNNNIKSVNNNNNIDENQVIIQSIEEQGNIPDEDIEYEQEDDELKSDLQDSTNFNDLDDVGCILICNENLKFRISSSYLPHNFELFIIKYESFFSTVARFHLPIVRGYYNGSSVYLLPSCISACFTMMNIDYKYFAGSKDPIEIINKYRMRGFGTYLNDKEKVRMIEYSTLVEKWKQMYNINIKNNDSISSFFGYIPINSRLFRPSNTLKNENTIYSIIDDQLKINNSNIDNLYSQLFNGKFNVIDGIQEMIYKSTCIGKLGYIAPLRKWLIEACYEQPIKALI